MWVVNTPKTNGVYLADEGGPLTTGSATVAYRKAVGGVDHYLQADGTTWSTSPHSFAAPYVAGLGFVHEMTVPPSALGETISFFVTHSVEGLVYSEEHEVVEFDTGGGGGGDGELGIGLKA